MSLSPVAKSLIDAALAFATKDGTGFMAAIHDHDWKTVAEDVILVELQLASAAGVPGAGLAMKLAPFAIAGAHFALTHPAPVESPAMEKAAGNGNVAM